jgi:hypothetical protein
MGCDSELIEARAAKYAQDEYRPDQLERKRERHHPQIATGGRQLITRIWRRREISAVQPIEKAAKVQ